MFSHAIAIESLRELECGNFYYTYLVTTAAVYTELLCILLTLSFVQCEAQFGYFECACLYMRIEEIISTCTETTW